MFLRGNNDLFRYNVFFQRNPIKEKNHMAIIQEQELFSWKNIENLGDLERLKLVIDYMPDEKLMHFLEKACL